MVPAATDASAQSKALGRVRENSMTIADAHQRSKADQRILDCLAQGLPLVDRPYQVLASSCGLDEDSLVARIQALLAAGEFAALAPVRGSASAPESGSLAARLLGVMQSGVPMVSRPFEALGAMLDVTGPAVCEALREMTAAEVIGPIAPVLRQRGANCA